MGQEPMSVVTMTVAEARRQSGATVTGEFCGN
jgi:hypothetical protein